MKKLIYLLIVVLPLMGCCKELKSQTTIPDIFVFVGEDCLYVVEDFKVIFDFMDNCGIKDTIQLPAPGTVVSIITNPTISVEVIARDYSDNIARVTVNVVLIDTVPPIITPKTMIVGIVDEFDLIGGSKLRATPIIVRGDGIIRELSAYHIGYDSNKMNLGVYTNKSTRPDVLLTSTGEVKCNSTKGWQVIPVKEEIKVLEGDSLWLAFMTDSDENQGVQASPIDRMSDVAAVSGSYTEYMPGGFGDSKQYMWAHSVHMRYTLTQDEPVQIIAEKYLEVERYINDEIADYVGVFNWSTANIDTVFAYPKCIPIGDVITIQ